MPQANDSILVTPGSGATVATELINSKEHQVVLLADAAGHIIGGRETFVGGDDTGLAAAAASSTPLAIFNASATHTLEISHIIITLASGAVTGLISNFRVHRITANVSAGNTAVTPIALDSGDTLTGSVTCNRQSAAATPMTGHTISGIAMGRATLYGEETGGGESRCIVYNELEVGEPILCKQNQGIIIVKDGAAGTGTIFATVYFRQRAN